MLLFPTIAVVAWLQEFLRPLFGTTCGTASGFGTLGAPDLAFSPGCRANSLQLLRGGLLCPDYPLYSCVRFLSWNDHRQKMTPPPDRMYQSSTLKAGRTRMNNLDTRHRARTITPTRAVPLTNRPTPRWSANRKQSML